MIEKKIIRDGEDDIFKMLDSIPSSNMSEEKLEYISEKIEKAHTELGTSDIFYDVLDRINILTSKRRRSDAKNPSGYYKITAKVIHEELDGYVTFHRGEGLPDLEKDQKAYWRIFSRKAIVEIESTQEYVATQSIFYDIFTQEEVADVIKDVFPEVMNISIEPVLANSIDDYFSVCCGAYDDRPTHTQQTSLTPSDSDKYTLSIRWYDPSLMA